MFWLSILVVSNIPATVSDLIPPFADVPRLNGFFVFAISVVESSCVSGVCVVSLESKRFRVAVLLLLKVSVTVRFVNTTSVATE